VVTREVKPSGDVRRTAFQREDLAATLASSFPDVEQSTRVIKTWVLMSIGQHHLEHTIVEVDASFLQMFSYPLAAGSAASALDGLDHMVVSKAWADRMFGDTFTDYAELVGKEVLCHGNQGAEAFTISGVFEDLPSARSLDFEAVIRYENKPKFGWSNQWDSPASTYVTLRPSANVADLRAKMRGFSREFVAPVFDRFKGRRWKDEEDAFLLELQAVGEIRLNPEVGSGYESSTGPGAVLTLIGMIAVILAIACINFTTLAIARSVSRTTEVGVRKALGAGRVHIVRQFLAPGSWSALPVR
jgi:putative ABC transport system permease protein